MDGIPKPEDERLLRHCLEVARRARRHGNHPFGAILASPNGDVLIEQENAFLPDRDMTGHAERVLMSRASTIYAIEFLRNCTVYSSAEPCAMCAGAIYWTGVGRLVYGMSEHDLKNIIGNHAENPTLDLPCRVVFSAGQRQVEVIGPLLSQEAAEIHAGAWGERSNGP